MKYIHKSQLFTFTEGQTVQINGRSLVVRHVFSVLDGCLAVSEDGSQLFNVTSRGNANQINIQTAEEMIDLDRKSAALRLWRREYEEHLKHYDKQEISDLFGRVA